jgi:hypothetical protein
MNREISFFMVVWGALLPLLDKKDKKTEKSRQRIW